MAKEDTEPTGTAQSQPILDAHKNRTRILAELENPHLPDEYRHVLHADLLDAETAYAAAVQDTITSRKPKQIKEGKTDGNDEADKGGERKHLGGKA